MTAVCALSTVALFPEFDLRLAALSLAHCVGVRGPVPLCTGWQGGAGCMGLCSPLQVSPLPSHCACHTFTEGVRGAPAPSPWQGWQPGRAWVGRASPPVFTPDVQCRGAPARPVYPQPRISVWGAHGLKRGLGAQRWALHWGPSVCELDPLTGCVVAYMAGDTLRHNPGSVHTESAQQGTLLGGRAN